MSNYIEYKDSVAFHPGYYIKEIIDESGLTQADFAARLNTTPKNLSLLVRGEQQLSVDMAMKLSNMLGTSAEYWLNLQSAYDAVLASIASDKEIELEKPVLKALGYDYFRDNFGLPDLPRKISEQVIAVREFLHVASLTVLKKPDLNTSFRSASPQMGEDNIARANAMVQISINQALKTSAPSFDKRRFELAIDYALTQTCNHETFYESVRSRFLEAGVILIVLPNLPGSNTSGATKKIGKSVMIMVNDRRLYADTFWFTLLHEVGHVMSGDFGISFNGEKGSKEKATDEFAENKLIDPLAYEHFLQECNGKFTASNIRLFAEQIGRDPGIVLGRLENDGYIGHGSGLQSLKRKYRVIAS
jgi:addiction module HigA family antidote